ncbi:nitronate monooxygenase [Halovenus aranensis]|jgi:nitronate monooxygenase|uniref:Nitronate monooxygenase n=1 Tax=Halovenus aranensis TaxID=890420 RepID=A0A1G8YU96_9EURY|nr:nitronate monooxygenase [Halovenus aranensis]SDK06409.1 nitronate monooxygenase [Halovenus aranensis]
MAQLSTRLTERLDLDVPIVQAPIGSATCPDLACAVADAGGLGTLAVTWRDPEAIRAAVSEMLDQTAGTVAVNIVLDPEAKSTSTARQVECCLDEGVEVFSFSFGDARPYVEQIHDNGGTVLQTVGSGVEATEAVEAGVDIVVAQGWEAGGHVQSEVATLPLVPRVVDAVPETPVVAAGGIADGRGVAAALALGADGAWLGTRFLATDEARIHRLYRERVLTADETATVFGTPFDEGWPDVPHRVLENETVERWTDAGRPESDRPGAGETVAQTPDCDPVRRYEDSLAVPGMDGAVEELPLYAGQSVGLTEDTQAAGDLVDELAAGTNAALGDLPVTRRRE